MSMKKKLAIILGAISCVVCIAVAVTVGVLVVGGDDEPTYYKVTFDTQGGSAMEDIKILAGDIIGEIERLPSKQCSRLIGFAMDTVGNMMCELDKYRVNGDLKLYAIWTESHTWSEWEEILAPGCETEGEKTRSCEACGDTEKASIAVLGHDFEIEFTVDVAPTCEGTGMESRHCTRCDATTDSREITATGHTWSDWTETVAPTCTEAGEKTRTCEICDTAETETVEVLGHDYSDEYTVDVAPTCTTAGSESRHCTRCDATTDGREITATGHTWSDWTETKSPTCVEYGVNTRVCSVCQETDEESIPVLGHLWNGWEETLSPTCTDEGKQERKCLREGCNVTEKEEVAALGHDTEGQTWQNDEYFHWKICLRCEAEVEKAQHSFESGICVCGAIEDTPESDFLFRSIGNNEWEVYDYIGSSKYLTIPATYNGGNVTRIGDGTFASNNLKSVSIPENITTIGEHAFASCINLHSIEIPSTVTRIERNAFDRCPSMNVNITDIEAWLKINFENEYANPFNDGRYYGNLYLNGELVTNLVIPDGITEVKPYAFSGYTKLHSIHIPDSVVKMSASFYYCDALDIYITDINTWLQLEFIGSENSIHIGDLYINGELAEAITISNIKDIRDNAFIGCDSLKTVEIDESVMSIGDYAFYGCANLQSITIPNSVTTLGESAFVSCKCLQSVKIGTGVRKISNKTFLDCGQLSSIEIAEGNPIYHSEANCIIHTAAKSLVFGCKTSIIPDDGSVTVIGSEAFAGCQGLTSIEIPASITSIGTQAFRGCANLQSVVIKSEEIREDAFWDCTGLQSIVIGIEVKRIYDSAFGYCQNLESVTFEGTINDWKKIYKYSNWNQNWNLEFVTCTDGKVYIG